MSWWEAFLRRRVRPPLVGRDDAERIHRKPAIEDDRLEAKDSERTHVTLFVPGLPSSLAAWKKAGAARGLTFDGGTLRSKAMPFEVGVQWEDNPRDGSFGAAFSFGTASPAQQREIDGAGGAVVLFLPVDLHREREAIARLARALAGCGAMAIRIEQSKLGYPIERWIELVGGTDPWTLYRAAVVVLNEAELSGTCGMHVFSLPDARVAHDDQTDANVANELLGTLNVYQLDEDPLLVSGHTFSGRADAPRRELVRWPDDGYPASHPCRNPFGVWRVGPPGGTGHAPSKLAFVAMPAFAVLLTALEAREGRSLTREEVENAVSGAACMALEHKDAQKLERTRGYADIDPELAWEQWQVLRGVQNGADR